MTWKNRWPTAEEAKAHAEKHDANPGGCWLYRVRPDEVPRMILRIFVLRVYDNDVVYAGEVPHRSSTADRCSDILVTPWLCPIINGNPVSWPGEETKLERRLTDLENWYKLTKAAGGGPDHYKAGEILELARDLLAEAKGWEQQTSEVIDQANKWKDEADA